MASSEQRLEHYSEQHPEEVLIITVRLEEEIDQIMVYKGFSSSLTRPTAFNPDIPIIPHFAEILTIDRLKSPYIPDSPQYLEQGLTWTEMEQRL